MTGLVLLIVAPQLQSIVQIAPDIMPHSLLFLSNLKYPYAPIKLRLLSNRKPIRVDKSSCDTIERAAQVGFIVRTTRYESGIGK